jgi:hypothetical protein
MLASATKIAFACFQPIDPKRDRLGYPCENASVANGSAQLASA